MLHITHSLTDTTQDLTTHSLHSLTHSLTHSLRWLPSVWQAQYPEPPEGAAARVVAAGAACCLRGRRSTQSLQKGLRRALSPLVPLAVLVAGAVSRASRRGCGARCRRWCRWLSSWQAQYPRASRRGCGARCRRWCRLLSSWQAQYPEPPAGAAARVVAAGAVGCPRDRRSTQSLQKGLRRALSPLVPLAVLVAGAVPRRGCGARCRRWCRWLFSAWQAQYPEPPEGAAARVVAAGAACCLRGRRSTQSLQKGLRRALSPLVPLAVLVAGAVQKGLRRALSPLVPLAVFVAGAVPRASRRGCGARCRRWCRWLSSWQAQYPEPPEGAAARVVAAGAAAGCPRGRRSIQSL